MYARFLIVVALAAIVCNGFAPLPQTSKRSHSSSLNMLIAHDVPPPPIQQTVATTEAQDVIFQSPLHLGARDFIGSSHLVSLKERKIPTAEEIAEKKRNFNVLFWGGGFVAPFLATIFYFGPKFWEK